MPQTYDPKFWRDRAAHARGLAQTVEDPETRQVLLEIARLYDQVTERAINLTVIPRKKGLKDNDRSQA
jgi:hypothetical protein